MNHKIKLKHPFELCAMEPREYDTYQGIVKKQVQIVEMINEVKENDIDIKFKATRKMGLSAVIDEFEVKYPLLTGNEVLQIIHQSIVWDEGSAPSPMGVEGSKMLTILHANIQ